MNAVLDTHGAKARKSAYLCYALAVLVMFVTGWFVVEGVQSTEPESSARYAKVGAGVLLLVLEMCAFALAGAWREFSPVLRALGWSIFALQIVLMSLAQIAVGMSAGKAAALSTATIEEIRAQSGASRQAAQSLLADAEKMRGSKNAWVRQQAGEKSTAAAQQTTAGADALAQLKQLQGTSTSTPVLEMIGKPGLIALSIALSVILELSGIVLMHTAGSLRRRADGALPVDVQILELLHRVHGVPAAPAQTSYRQPHAVAPTGASTGLSYGGKVMLAGGGLLAATAAPMAHSAPAVPTQAKAPAAPLASPANGASETVHPAASVSVQSHGAESVQSGASGPALAGASETVQSGASVSVQSDAKKPRVKRAVSAKLDTGTDGKAGARFKRIKAAVKAGKLKPSLRAIQALEGGSQDVVLGYLQQLEAEGVTVRHGRGWVLATKGGAA